MNNIGGDEKKNRFMTNHLCCSILTSSCDEPSSNLNPGKMGGLGSELRKNGKAGDLVSEVPRCGELHGLKLKYERSSKKMSSE